MRKPSDFPARTFRLGTTSYIIPADILPNVQYLADKVDDIELVLFDVDEYSNLPDAALVTELNNIAAAYDLTYTVHLPLDLRFGSDTANHNESIEKALRTMESTAALNPFAYIAHLDSHRMQDASPASTGSLLDAESVGTSTIDDLLAAIDRLTTELPDRKMLAVENLESYPPERNDQIIERAGVSYCVDIGHLLLQQRDPCAYLEKRIAQTRVIHLHGVGTRDHQSLAHIDRNQLQWIWKLLHDRSYSGVLTLEIFSTEDFMSSLDSLREIL